MFREHGYEETTAAEIAAKAGVTERTFFRHFPDKREVLFDGDTAFIEALTTAVLNAPEALGPWDTLFFAFNTVKHMFVENRPFTEPRQHVIASSPALQERAAAKTRALIAAVESMLCARGLTVPQANLAAQMGMATLSHGVAAWFNDGSIDLGEHIVKAFQEARDLSSAKTAIAEEKLKESKPLRKSRTTLS
ncbi:TetR/AcrR family transcriptional regulator [Granulicella arctica]|uniref:AcrR family transcriptional regulator n=1 Tax=Granulicella arctica TaxID=940613 RepID=A0A7Y9PIM8_9BACT|nr:TetR/AcrR family transcriptional regulator [Granulicella arctica]NYF80599.1 AcrR family transcriptional regulator [Granulicella arctica]